MKMGKIAVFALLCCLLPLTAFGFDLTVGVKGGIGAPHFSGPDYQNTLDTLDIKTQLKFGFSGGVFVAVGLFDLLAIQPEAHYAFLGGRFGDNTGSIVQDSPVVQIPVLVKGRLQTGNLTVTPVVGPAVLFKIGEWNNKVTDADGNVVLSGTYTDNDVANYILGIVAGIGFELSVIEGVVSLEARYLLGLTPRFDQDVIPNSDVRQNNVELLVGFGFPVIK